MIGTLHKPDAKAVVRDLEPGEIVKSHQHARGHFSIFDGDVVLTINGADHRVIHNCFYVPAEMVHSIRAIGRTRMYCVGREDF
jgi:quercetin dioxygenase-like cupin family protein